MGQIALLSSSGALRVLALTQEANHRLRGPYRFRSAILTMIHKKKGAFVQRGGYVVVKITAVECWRKFLFSRQEAAAKQNAYILSSNSLKYWRRIYERNKPSR